MKRYIVNLTEEERTALGEVLLRERVSRELLQRARILLAADEGLTDEEIAEELEVGRATVERVRRRAVEEGLERALKRKRSETPPRPPKLDGAGEAHLVLLACSAPPEGRQRWTLHLLSERLVELGVVDSISHSTVHRRLKKKRAEALANRALLHPAGGERRFRPCHGGRARRLPSSV
jgi:transposase